MSRRARLDSPFLCHCLFAATNKHVSWLLGCDGDVCVRVIGEVDEFRSSKLLQNLLNNRLAHTQSHSHYFYERMKFDFGNPS